MTSLTAAALTAAAKSLPASAYFSGEKGGVSAKVWVLDLYRAMPGWKGTRWNFKQELLRLHSAREIELGRCDCLDGVTDRTRGSAIESGPVVYHFLRVA